MIKSVGVIFVLAGAFASCKSANSTSSTAKSEPGQSQSYHNRIKTIDVDLTSSSDASSKSGEDFDLEVSYDISPRFETKIPELTAHWVYHGAIGNLCNTDLKVQKKLVQEAAADKSVSRIVLRIKLPVSYPASGPKELANDAKNIEQLAVNAAFKGGRCKRTFSSLNLTMNESSTSGSSQNSSAVNISIFPKSSKEPPSSNNVSKMNDKGVYKLEVTDFATVQLPDSAFKAGESTKIHFSEKVSE